MTTDSKLADPDSGFFSPSTSHQRFFDFRELDYMSTASSSSLSISVSSPCPWSLSAGQLFQRRSVSMGQRSRSAPAVLAWKETSEMGTQTEEPTASHVRPIVSVAPTVSLPPRPEPEGAEGPDEEMEEEANDDTVDALVRFLRERGDAFDRDYRLQLWGHEIAIEGRRDRIEFRPRPWQLFGGLVQIQLINVAFNVEMAFRMIPPRIMQLLEWMWRFQWIQQLAFNIFR